MYKELLSKNIKTQPDTDHGILKAYWDTAKDLIGQKADRKEIRSFLAEVKRQWGDFKYSEMKGDFVDAGLIS